MSQMVPEKAPQPALPAAKLFAEFVTRRTSDSSLDFEAFCRAHPAAERDLRLLHAHWEHILAVLDHLGVGSSLAPSASGGVVLPSQGHSSEVLRRLAGRRHTSKRYSVQGEVARGGMGAILRVWDEDLRRNLAMKVVLSQADPKTPEATQAVDSLLLGRFLEEAQITSQLEHPGIVPVHELGQDADGRVFFTMRLVSGRDLEHIFALVREGQEGWTRTRAVGVVLKICEAMAYAHDKGVIHRDLKPANVMVGRFGEVYVMDWGLSRVIGQEDKQGAHLRSQARPGSRVSTHRMDLLQSGSASGSALHTMDGDIIGTPSYMSPEQARGDLSAMGPVSDVYSTGAILYHLLAGHMPYAPTGTRPNAIEVWQRARKESPEPLLERAPDAPAELIAICEKAMAREPQDRYGGMLELAEDLRAYLEGRVVHAFEAGAFAELKKWFVRNKGLAITVLVSLFVILAGTTTASFVLADKNKELEGANRASRKSERKAIQNEQLAKQSAAIAEERATRILRLSDAKRLQELLKQADTLWPAAPENGSALEDWLARSRELISRLPEHREALEHLRRRALPQAESAEETSAAASSSGAQPQRSWSFESPEDRWQHDTQAELVAGLEAFAIGEHGGIPDVERRLEFARTVEARTISGDEARALWKQALDSISDPAACPKYAGLTIQPQLGLLPLGQDRESGLWEFAHLQTGEAPVRNPATGMLELNEDCGFVFVLIPGGTFDMGAQRVDPDAPNYDPEAEDDEAPVHEVTLDPFLMSKYEFTQGQWLRQTGANPSIYLAGETRGDVQITLLHPVEQVSWLECVELLGRLSLQLPTEAQWECSARAGTQTPWSTGEDKYSLEGACNILDRAARRIGAKWPGIDDWPELDDGHGVTAPCNEFLPNPFGLHNMHGNVWEWCRDEFGLYGSEVSPGDGERPGDPAQRANRGGSYYHPATATRSANRNRAPPDMRINHLGLRPACAIKVQ